MFILKCRLYDYVELQVLSELFTVRLFEGFIMAESRAEVVFSMDLIIFYVLL